MTINMSASTSTYTGRAGFDRPAGTDAAPPAAPLGHGPGGVDVLDPGGFAACGLDGRPQNAGQARRFVTATLDRWALRAVAADMKLIVSELVTNAVQHGLAPAPDGTADYPVWLGLFRYPTHLVCVVADPSPAPPRPLTVGASAVGGRGLTLIGELSDMWSWSPTPPRGKTVWASVALPAHAR